MSDVVVLCAACGGGGYRGVGECRRCDGAGVELDEPIEDGET